MTKIKLGLGLVSIGRTWGTRQTLPPTRAVALELITHAFDKGIRFFDTAPAYNTSEEILGHALRSRPDISHSSTIATKAGEHWEQLNQTTRVDHSYDALCQSIDRSLSHLGRIDVLQIHKATEESLKEPGVERAINYARGIGTKEFGASVSNLTAAHVAIDTGLFDWLQFPVNSMTPVWRDVHERLAQKNMRAIANRPFAMGALIETGELGRITAFSYVLKCGLPDGSIVLTGTASPRHLVENITSFQECIA